MSTPNIALLDRTLERIRENKKRWNQGWWRGVPETKRKAVDPQDQSCGTSMCFAGWAVTLDGGRWAVPDKKLIKAGRDGSVGVDFLIARKAEIENPEIDTFELDGKIVISAETRARHILGLNKDQSYALFEGDNKISDLKRIIKQIKTSAKASA